MINNFEALMPLIVKYVEEHPEEYQKYLDEIEKREDIYEDNPLCSEK